MQRHRVFSAVATLILLAMTMGCRGTKSEKDSGLPPLPPPVDKLARESGVPAPQRALRLALVGEIRGELEPCGCPTVPYGGFVRRQNYLDQLRGDGAPLFHLDAGDALVKGISTTSRGDTADRAALILGLMREVGVDAFTPGPSDLLALGETWQAALSGAGFPVISATWLDPTSGALAFPATAILERGDRRVGVIGLSARPSAPDARDLVQMIDPVEASRAALASLPEDLDLVVALSNLSDQDADRVAEVQGIAAVLSTRAGRYDEPRETAGAPVIETPDRGRYITVLELHLGAAAGQPLTLDKTSSTLLRDLGRARRQLKVLEPGSPALTPTIERIAALEAEVSALATGRNLVYRDDEPLGREFDDEATVDEALAAFRGVQLERAKVIVGSAATNPVGPRYATAAACTGCHAPQVAYWTYTDHVNALDSLTARGSDKDPECVSCHTTGFAQPGGFADVENHTKLQQFKGVQCESCHGPLSTHPGGGGKPQPVTEATCLTCHDEANSPSFDYETYLPRARCPPSN